MPVVDDYLLKRSEQFTLGNTEEGRTDLTLTQSTAQTGRIRGLVTNAVTGNPIENAVVKLRTQSGDPIVHTLTNAAGRYSLAGIPAGTYTLNVTFQGYATSAGQTFTITQNQILEINVSLTPVSATNTVYGIITNQATGEPINDAYVVLAQAPGAAQNVIQALSNKTGEYILSSIPNGTRTLIVDTPGYYVSSFIPIDVSGGVIINTDVALQQYQFPQSTVNGYIKNQNGAPLVDACVGLYLIDQNGVEILQQITYADSQGFYIFGRVSAGNYVVKAKSEKTVQSIV